MTGAGSASASPRDARSDPVAITRDLVRIPSHVGSGSDEVEVAEYIEAFLSSSTLFSLSRQKVEGRRYNLVARSDHRPTGLLLAGHMDTVDPKAGWSGDRDQFAAEVDGGMLFGLGSLDMKSGIAAILAAAASLTYVPDGLELLFYCDEEYDFAGMRTYIERHRGEPPRRCVIAEPTDLLIRTDQRGLVEVDLTVTGVTGHSSNPEGGTNAIDGIWSVIERTRAWLSRFASPSLGAPTVNVAFLRGGLRPADPTKSPVEILGRRGNNIADWAEAVIEVRTTTEECRAEPLVEYMRAQAGALGLGVEEVLVRHDLGAMTVQREEVAFVEDALRDAGLGVSHAEDGKRRGYSDVAMLRSAWGVPVATLGPRGSGMHAVDECVEIASIGQLQAAITSLIGVCCAPTRDR